MNRAKRITGAFLAAMTLLSACAGSSTQLEPQTAAKPDKAEIKAVEAVIPDPVAEGTDAEKFIQGDAHWDWWQAYREKVDASRGKQERMEQYYELIQKELLDNAADGNAVCSPLNIYIALSMLAEVTDGNTRKQILDVLRAKDMDVLRERTKALWDANYLDTPVVKSLLANSMWLRNDIGYHGDTLKRLAELYHASSYSGEMGSDQLNEQLRKWTDEHTGGLLTEYTKEMELQPEGVLSLISTIYYKASWNEKFLKDRTEEGIFHGLAGDQAVPMMHRDDMMSLYQTEHFQAVGLNLADSGTMYFFLPKEGCTAQNIAADPEMIRICMDPSGMNSDYPLVHLTVPKFDVSDKIDLPDHLKALGIKDALSAETADFSPLTEEVKRIWLSSAEHAATVKIDEEGVTGAAYTDLAMAGAGMPQDEVDFVLDRPFVFAVASPDGSIFFAGVVQNAEDSFSGGIYVPADKKRLTEEQALEMIRNYCYSSNPELKEMEQSDKYTIGWDVSTKEEKEIVVLYRSYTGAQIRYYIDPVSGETYVTELVPGIINEEQRTDESFNIWDTLATEAGNTIPEERNWDRIPTVMIDGVLYESTGYISSAIGCGNMDGKITSAVEGPEAPTKNDQSNFGTGYDYQRSSEGQIVVVMDGMKVIFRDPEHSFTVDIPEEVLNFNAKVLEVRNGSLLVSFISTPDVFMPPFTGQCVVRVNPQILKEEVKAGDTVRVWFDGLVQEIYPPILPNVYRVVKEEQEPAEAYHQNEDGSWCYMDRNYQNRLMLTGTLPNAAADSFYVVLSDYDDITFEDAADFLLSSTRHPDEENRFVIANLGVYTPECEVESAKVVVSAVEAAPTEITVCFDQYDNTVQSELLTGEYFALEKKDGEQWTEVVPVIENAAFTAVGIILQKGVITRKTFNWEWLYGRQEPGQYRIRVQVVDNTVHEAVAEFMIPE